jgi:predicted ribosome quality control (RQC) complex YloA/Tae2 family protein
VGVIINFNGQLGTVQSSARFKDDIKSMDKASEAILALKPVTFRYKEDLDPDRIPQFGLIAEEVEKVAPDLVVRDDGGKVSTVRYEAVNAMLLNEFLKEHRKVQEQDATITSLKSVISQQQYQFQAKFSQQEKQIQLLSTAMQKVNDRLELTRPALQVAANER